MLSSRSFAMPLLFAATVCVACACAQDQEPVKGANLPNSPSSLITAHPAGKGKIPLEELPHPPVALSQLPLNIGGDMLRIFLSPLTVRPRDLLWMVPLAAATSVTLATDTRVSHDVVGQEPTFNSTADNISNGLRDGFYAVPAAMYIVGHMKDDAKLNETGVLGGEAMIDAYLVDEFVKLCSFRERPLTDNSRGNFYVGSSGYNSSFVSGHAMTAWSSAAVIAAEYPSPWVQTGLYTAASAVSINRVLAQKHFPTDVLLGSAGGWLVGHYVVRAHHHTPIYRRQVAARPVTMALLFPGQEK